MEFPHPSNVTKVQKNYDEYYYNSTYLLKKAVEDDNIAVVKFIFSNHDSLNIVIDVMEVLMHAYKYSSKKTIKFWLRYTNKYYQKIIINSPFYSFHLYNDKFIKYASGLFDIKLKYTNSFIIGPGFKKQPNPKKLYFPTCLVTTSNKLACYINII